MTSDLGTLGRAKLKAFDRMSGLNALSGLEWHVSCWAIALMRRVFLILLMATVHSFSIGQEPPPNASGGCWVPGLNATMPSYFSGTLNVASGMAYCYGPPPGNEGPTYFVNAKLIIQGGLAESEDLGEVVKEFNYIPGEPVTVHTALSAAFDSTHFPHGSMVRIIFEATDNFGRLYTDRTARMVKNRALIMNHPFEDISPITRWMTQSFDVVMEHLTQKAAQYDYAKYQQMYLTGSGWGPQSVANNLPNTTFMYVNSHGSSGSHQTGQADGDGGFLSMYAQYITPNQSYFDLLVQNTGAGLPPFNSTNTPPIHITFFDTCVTMQSDDMELLLFPYMNQFAGTIHFEKNQAVAGWTCYTQATKSRFTADHLVNALAKGYTIEDCLAILREKMELFDVQVSDNMYLSPLRPVVPEDLKYFGDRYARAASVYTGTNEWVAGRWYN